MLVLGCSYIYNYSETSLSGHLINNTTSLWLPHQIPNNPAKIYILHDFINSQLIIKDIAMYVYFGPIVIGGYINYS